MSPHLACQWCEARPADAGLLCAECARCTKLCPRCRSWHRGDSKACDGCRAAASTRDRMRRARRTGLGMCRRCGDAPPAGGSVRCAACRLMQNAYGAKYRRARRAAGMCVRCYTKRPDEGYSACLACRHVQGVYRRRRRAEV